MRKRACSRRNRRSSGAVARELAGALRAESLPGFIRTNHAPKVRLYVSEGPEL